MVRYGHLLPTMSGDRSLCMLRGTAVGRLRQRFVVFWPLKDLERSHSAGGTIPRPAVILDGTLARPGPSRRRWIDRRLPLSFASHQALHLSIRIDS